MSISIAGDAAVITSGRGKAKVSISVDFAKLEAWARKMKIDEEKLMKQSFGRACRGLRAKLAEVMENGGGVNGVPKFADFDAFTRELREKRGTSGQPMGGVLADKWRIVAFKRNGAQVIGWPDALAKVVNAFQNGEGNANDPFTNAKKRRDWHRMGIRDIPRAYKHVRRQILPDNFGGHVKTNLNEWAKHAYYKELARQMKKAGDL